MESYRDLKCWGYEYSNCLIYALVTISGGGGGGGVKCYPCLSVCMSVRPFVPSKKILYNQLLPQFLINQSESLHNCNRHIEDVHLFFL